MRATFEFQPDIFLLLPVVAFGRVGDTGDIGVAFGWLFWVVAVYRA